MLLEKSVPALIERFLKLENALLWICRQLVSVVPSVISLFLWSEEN